MKHLFLAIFTSIVCLPAAEIPVYIGTGGAGIYGSSLNTETGVLAEPRVIAEIPSPNFLSLSKSGEVLYTTTRENNKDGGVAGFKISGEDGLELALLNQQSAKGSGSCHVNIDQSGQMLMVANYGGGSCASFPLKEDGSIGEAASFFQHEGSSVNEKRQKSPHPHSIYPGPDNKFAYVPDLGTDEVVIYALNVEEGSMKKAGAAEHPAGGGPRHMKFGKNGKHAYVLSELTLEVVVYDRDEETGRLTVREKVSNLKEGANKEKMSCSEIRVSKDGKFIYVANRDLKGEKRDSVSVLKVLEDGGVELVQVAPAEVWIPRNINLSPDGKWLLVAGQKSNEVTVFAVDPESGEIKFTGQRFEIPKAMCIEFGSLGS